MPANPSKSPSVHFGSGPTFYGTPNSGGATGATYLPYGTPSIQTYFQPTSQTSNNVSATQLNSSSHTSNTNQNFVALGATAAQQPNSLNTSGSSNPLLHVSTKSPFQTSTPSTTSSTTGSPNTIYSTKKYNKGGLTTNISATNTTGGSNTSANRAISPSYEEDSVSTHFVKSAYRKYYSGNGII